MCEFIDSCVVWCVVVRLWFCRLGPDGHRKDETAAKRTQNELSVDIRGGSSPKREKLTVASRAVV